MSALDLVVVAALHAECFAEAWSAGSIAALLAAPGAFGLVAVIDGAPAGFILIRAAGDEAEILSLGVAPPQRRRGLARRLLEAALDRLGRTSARRLLLEVAEDNAAARRLYEAAGFSPVGRRPDYYREGGLLKPAMVMARGFESSGLGDGRTPAGS